MIVHGGQAQLPAELAAALGDGIPVQELGGDPFTDRLAVDAAAVNQLVKLLTRHYTPTRSFGQPTSVPVGTSAAQVLPYDPDRLGGLISIPQGSDVWMAGDKTVRVGNGLWLQTSVAPSLLLLEPEDTQAFYMVSAGSQITVTALVKRA